MYKRFRTVSGKRMKVKMTEEEYAAHLGLMIAQVICGLLMGVILWLAI